MCGEVWVSDWLCFGVFVICEMMGMVDNMLVGVDILLCDGDDCEFLVEYVIS